MAGAGTSVPHDHVPPPAASLSPHWHSLHAKGCGCSRGRSVGEGGVGKRGHRVLRGYFDGRGTPGRSLELPLLILGATGHGELGQCMGTPRAHMGHKHSPVFALAPGGVPAVRDTNLWPSRTTLCCSSIKASSQELQPNTSSAP